MKRNKIVLLLLICVICFSVFVVSPAYTISVDATNTSAKAMCVLEKDSKRVIYSHNMDASLPMASTTKVMTAITAIQNCDNLDELIQVDDCSIGVEGTSIYLRKGEVISVRDLLYGLMLRSGNDAATALACHVGGSVEGFASIMNELAVKIGAINSNFTNPHGLDDKNHYTTAYDLALISAYALNNPIFKEIVSTKSHVIPETNVSDKRYLTNKNRLLSSLNGCCGVKTGFTSKAGRCLVSAVERDNTTYVCVVLNCGPMFEESASLLNSCFETYENKKIIDKDSEIFNEYILNGKEGRLYLYAEEDFNYPLCKDEFRDLRLEYNVELKDAQVNEEVGEIKVFFKNHLIKTVKLFTMNKIDKLVKEENQSIEQILWEEKLNEN